MTDRGYEERTRTQAVAPTGYLDDGCQVRLSALKSGGSVERILKSVSFVPKRKLTKDQAELLLKEIEAEVKKSGPSFALTLLRRQVDLELGRDPSEHIKGALAAFDSKPSLHLAFDILLMDSIGRRLKGLAGGPSVSLERGPLGKWMQRPINEPEHRLDLGIIQAFTWLGFGSQHGCIDALGEYDVLPLRYSLLSQYLFSDTIVRQAMGQGRPPQGAESDFPSLPKLWKLCCDSSDHWPTNLELALLATDSSHFVKDQKSSARFVRRVIDLCPPNRPTLLADAKRALSELEKAGF